MKKLAFENTCIAGKGQNAGTCDFFPYTEMYSILYHTYRFTNSLFATQSRAIITRRKKAFLKQ